MSDEAGHLYHYYHDQLYETTAFLSLKLSRN